jgi:hypothetical protein
VSLEANATVLARYPFRPSWRARDDDGQAQRRVPSDHHLKALPAAVREPNAKAAVVGTPGLQPLMRKMTR